VPGVAVTLALADDQAAARITTRHLLSHTGGFYGELEWSASATGDDAVRQYVDEVMPTLPQLFAHVGTDAVGRAEFLHYISAVPRLEEMTGDLNLTMSSAPAAWRELLGGEPAPDCCGRARR